MKHQYRWNGYVVHLSTEAVVECLESWDHIRSGARSSSHQCTTFCYGFRVERHVSWQRCATGFEIRFHLFGGCVRNVSPISSNMCIHHAVLKRQLAHGSKWSRYKCVRCSWVYATIEDIRRHVCRAYFAVLNTYLYTKILRKEHKEWPSQLP